MATAPAWSWPRTGSHPITALAVSSVPHQLAGMASAGNNAFRQVGSALGPAVLGALLTSRATSTLAGHVSAMGLGRLPAQSILVAMRAGGFEAVGALRLGADYNRAMGALSSAFLDGFHVCVLVSASLMGLAALLAAFLLPGKRPASAAVSDYAYGKRGPYGKKVGHFRA